MDPTTTTTDAVIDPNYLRLVGNRTGLIGPLYQHLPSRRDPKGYLSMPGLHALDRLVDGPDEIELAVGGKGDGVADALAASVGEAAERYCLLWPDGDALEYATYDALAGEASVVDFDYLDVIDPDERERNPDLASLDRDTELPWVAGTDLHSGESVYVPAELVWSHVGPLDGEPLRFLSSSNGLAAGPSLPAALLGSLYELVERDGFIRTWLTGRTPGRVAIDDWPGVAAYEAECVDVAHLSTRLIEYDPVVDVPAVGAMIVDDRRVFPAFIIGGGASLDPAAAMRSAIAEAVQGWPYIYEIGRKYDFGEVDPGRANDFEKNVLYYADPDHFDELSRLFAGDRARLDPADRPDAADQGVWAELLAVLGRLEDADCTPIALDVTTPDVRRAGISVTRVVVPELLPLTPPSAPPVGHPALDGVEVVDRPHPYP